MNKPIIAVVLVVLLTLTCALPTLAAPILVGIDGITAYGSLESAGEDLMLGLGVDYPVNDQLVLGGGLYPQAGLDVIAFNGTYAASETLVVHADGVVILDGFGIASKLGAYYVRTDPVRAYLGGGVDFSTYGSGGAALYLEGQVYYAMDKNWTLYAGATLVHRTLIEIGATYSF